MKIKYYKWDDGEYNRIYKRINDKMYFYDSGTRTWEDSYYNDFDAAYIDMVIDCRGTLKEISEKQAFIEML